MTFVDVFAVCAKQEKGSATTAFIRVRYAIERPPPETNG